MKLYYGEYDESFIDVDSYKALLEILKKETPEDLLSRLDIDYLEEIYESEIYDYYEDDIKEAYYD